MQMYITKKPIKNKRSTHKIEIVYIAGQQFVS